MPRLFRRRPLHWGALAGAAGALMAAASALSGCPGNIDPSITPMGAGGSGSGTGGMTGGGTGGSSVDCSGGNDGATVVGTYCVTGCHNPSGAALLGANLDLTVNSGIASRLVGVTSPGATGSSCGGNTEPYLVAGSSPAQGLLIQKISTNPTCSASETPPCCGSSMPYAAPQPLTTQQQQCVIEWATTLTTASQ